VLGLIVAAPRSQSHSGIVLERSRHSLENIAMAISIPSVFRIIFIGEPNPSRAICKKIKLVTTLSQ